MLENEREAQVQLASAAMPVWIVRARAQARTIVLSEPALRKRRLLLIFLSKSCDYSSYFSANMSTSVFLSTFAHPFFFAQSCVVAPVLFAVTFCNFSYDSRCTRRWCIALGHREKSVSVGFYVAHIRTLFTSHFTHFVRVTRTNTTFWSLVARFTRTVHTCCIHDDESHRAMGRPRD